MLDPQLDTRLQQAFRSASGGEGADFFLLPDSDDFSRIPSDPRNPLTAEKVTLGQMLYHETGLAINPVHEFSKGTYSCASCHFAAAGFQAGRAQGLADGGVGFGTNGEGRSKGVFYTADEVDAQPTRSPSVMNTAYQTNMLWNGQFGATGVNTGTENRWTADTPKAVNHLGYEGVETQAIAGLGVHRMDVENSDEIMIWYQTYFDDAFPDIPVADRYNKETAGLAIAAYERTVLANQAPFQRYLKGEMNALTAAEKRGALVFFETANCVNCHTGPALNSMEFYGLGMKGLDECADEVFRAGPELTGHLGRGEFTGLAEDNYKFKVPQLYNLADSPFYGHGASMNSIRTVIEYKNAAVSENANVPDSQLADDFIPQNLTPDQITDLEAFLSNGLRDPDLMRYQPASVVSGNCFPNNDPMSRNQLGCE